MLHDSKSMDRTIAAPTTAQCRIRSVVSATEEFGTTYRYTLTAQCRIRSVVSATAESPSRGMHNPYARLPLRAIVHVPDTARTD